MGISRWRAISQEDPKPNGQLSAEKGSVQLKDALEHVTQTKSKPRYKEESLIQDLEKNGVGRPSSYSGIVKTLKMRNYISNKGREIISTDIGRQANDWLIQRAGHLTDVHYTAQMEERLDKIAEGKEKKESIMAEVRDDLKRNFNAFQGWLWRAIHQTKRTLEEYSGKGENVPDSAFATMGGAKEWLDQYIAFQRSF